MTRSSACLILIDCLWCFLAFCFLLTFCVHKLSAHLPESHKKSRLFAIFQDLIRYGKTKQNHKAGWLRLFDVPKRWFCHFYIISVCWNTFLLLLLYLNYIYEQQSFPSWLTWTVYILTGAPSSDSPVPQLSTLLVQMLICVHSLRRLLECLFVSVFSDGAMHLVQYLFGLAYYIILGLTVLCSDRVGKGTGTILSQFHWIHVAGIVLFTGASLLQHQSMVLLARLRTAKSGRVETLAHRMPKGGCFELLSCPHYFAELLIYVSLSLAFCGLSLTWWLVVLYVFFNQALAGQLTHELYISKYESYPKHRRAFLPYLL